MQILLIPVGLMLWYWAYEAKPMNKDDVTCIWEKENFIKRAKLLTILKETN